jgi:uncharacterized protein YndB with AHSA1/START domain
MEGFLAGFTLAPKPLKGVTVFAVEHTMSTSLSIRDVLIALTTPDGLASWLGEVSEFACHVGVKFSVEVENESSSALFTSVDLPRGVVFMVEALGEFEFSLIESAGLVKIILKVRRALASGAEAAWTQNIDRLAAVLEGVMNGD